jgi:hypothetical protein
MVKCLHHLLFFSGTKELELVFFDGRRMMAGDFAGWANV